MGDISCNMWFKPFIRSDFKATFRSFHSSTALVVNWDHLVNNSLILRPMTDLVSVHHKSHMHELVKIKVRTSMLAMIRNLNLFWDVAKFHLHQKTTPQQVHSEAMSANQGRNSFHKSTYHNKTSEVWPRSSKEQVSNWISCLGNAMIITLYHSPSPALTMTSAHGAQVIFDHLIIMFSPLKFTFTGWL